MWRFAFLAILLAGCSTLSYEHEPLYHNPLAGTRWGAIAPRPRPPFNGPGKGSEDLRSSMIAAAEALLAEAGARPGFGAEDLQAIIEKSGARVGWRAEDDLGSLVRRAKKRGAYHESGRPSPGDIALFNDQRDADADGKTGDRFTGCGVVVVVEGERFDVVTRTDHAPRRVKVWPGGATERIVDGRKVNDFLRVPSRSDPPDARYLAGQLYAGHIDVEALAQRR